MRYFSPSGGSNTATATNSNTNSNSGRKMTAADFVVLNNFLSILSDLKNIDSTLRPSPDTYSNSNSDEESGAKPNWLRLFCFNREGEEGEEGEEENQKEESLENFCLFLSKIMSKLILGPDTSELNHSSWMTLSLSKLVKVRIARIVTLLVEVAAIVWKEATMKLRGIKEDDILSVSILNMKLSF